MKNGRIPSIFKPSVLALYIKRKNVIQGEFRVFWTWLVTHMFIIAWQTYFGRLFKIVNEKICEGTTKQMRLSCRSYLLLECFYFERRVKNNACHRHHHQQQNKKINHDFLKLFFFFLVFKQLFNLKFHSRVRFV